MLLRPTLVLCVLTWSCHADLRTQRCDPYRTPRIAGSPVEKGKEKSAHAPWISGDCAVCHKPVQPHAALTAEEAARKMPVIGPVNEHCVSCHRELFRRPPKGHPPEQAFCASCHDPHASRQKSLLLDDDEGRACLDYPPPYPAKAEPPRPKAAASRRTGP